MAKNEIELIENLKKGDKSSFEMVVRHHTVHLYNACRGLGFSDTESDDITQSVWLTFYDVVARFEGRSTLRSFLFGILYNKASEFRKQSRKDEPTENIEDLLDAHFDERGHWILSHSPVSAERFVESAQTLSVISKCLELLPLNQKMAFVLKEIEEEVTEEICNILKVSSTHLGVLLFRARNQLRECIDRKSR